MASFTVTTHAVFIPELWSKEAQLAREARLVMANLVERYDADFSGMGDILHIPKVSNLSVGNVGTDGSISDSAPTEGEVTITVDKWKYVSLNVPDMLKAQAKLDLLSLYSKKIGFALGQQVEDDLLALYDGLSTNSVGTAGSDLTDANLRLAVQKLDVADAPQEDRSLILYPTQRNALLGIDKFVRYDAVPYAKGESPILKGNIGELYGVSIFVSTRVPLSGSERKNLMWQRSAFGLAMQKDIKVEMLARTALADHIVGSELYGVAELRDDHAVKVLS